MRAASVHPKTHVTHAMYNDELGDSKETQKRFGLTSVMHGSLIFKGNLPASESASCTRKPMVFARKRRLTFLIFVPPVYPVGRHSNTSRPNTKIATRSPWRTVARFAHATVGEEVVPSFASEATIVATTSAWIHRESAQLANITILNPELGNVPEVVSTHQVHTSAVNGDVPHRLKTSKAFFFVQPTRCPC